MSILSERNFAIEWWPIDRPKDYAKNPRKWSEQAVEKVAASIREYGWKQPLVCDENDEIVIGHLRRAGGRRAGMTECPVLVARDLTPEQIRGLRLMDNRTHEEATWDYELLGPELADLQRLGFGLELTGFDEQELAAAMPETMNGLTDPDEAPPVPETPVSRSGDLWLLGGDHRRPPHRTLCGDATEPEAVERLMKGEQADMAFVDVPYNVSYEGYTEDHLTIEGDRMPEHQFKEFLETVFRLCRAAVKPGASLYVCHASSWQREFQNALEAAGFEVRCQIIWAKNTFAWGFGRYKFRHEPLFYCHVAGQSDAWYGDKSQSTLWEEDKPAASRIHPIMKPVALIARALLNSSQAGDCILDPAAGSGSTLIACEQNGRRAVMMEIDARYTDCICQRYRDFCGKPVVLESTGQTFDQVGESRAAVAA
jgi:DNA modification methylase